MKINPPEPWVVVGRIGRAIGLDGSVRVWPESDLDVLLEQQVPLAFCSQRNSVPTDIVADSYWMDSQGLVVRWKGFPTRESTLALRNTIVVARRENLPELEEGTVYWADLEGALVRDRKGRDLGYVSGLIESAAHIVIEVRALEGKEILIPFTEEVDPNLEPPGRNGSGAVLWINLLEGLEEATETPD
ncbi:ribosome maturation factor RimM [bacterium]|nr:MAG: Ribosome maturation factor RimM [Candidatus Hinthialibacteria bacterium OLB16]MCK6496448.1 ribosome maturation factor RimM [bacterium]NUP93147.1 16S rRNA processing protein RimM [Candidatus Omnitrophota bacterium]